METILVVGGAGYIGSHTVKKLLAKKFNVIVYDNLSSGHRWAVLKPAKLIVGDIHNQSKLDKVMKQYKPKTVIHFAASIEAGESMTDPDRFFQNNVVGTLSLLEVMAKNKIKRIIFSSSAAVYGEPKVSPIKEDVCLKPINAYGSTKMINEENLKYFDIAYGIKYVALRYFNAAGADPEKEIGPDHKHKTHLITKVMMAANKEIPLLEIFGIGYKTKDGTCIRDYVHVNDLAEAHILSINYLKKSNTSDCFNLGSGKGSSVEEVIRKAKKVTGVDFTVKKIGKREGDPDKLVANFDKAKKVLKYKPKYNLEDIVKTAWEWEKVKVNRRG